VTGTQVGQGCLAERMLRFRYASPTVPMSLVACPFCREMFEASERPDCPVCGVALTAMEKLPPSLDALAEDGPQAATAPEAEKLPWTDLRRNKGILLAVSLLGLVMFALPWVHLTFPYTDSRSAFDLARGKLWWMWAAGSAWLVLIPTVLSRRTILQMRGARIAAAGLAAIPAVSVGILLAFPPKSNSAGFSVHFNYGWPMWVTLGLAFVAIVAALRLGADSVVEQREKTLEAKAKKQRAEIQKEREKDQSLH
jgi:hypothetical protein